MIIGNSMVASALTLNRIKAELENRREEIQVLLGLGATARQASGTSLQAAVKSAMIPTIDSMKTVGLVQLPGMMTGLIIGGATPVEAVKYQILVLFMLTTAVSLTAMTVGFSRIASSSPRGISWFFSKKMSAALDRVNAKSARVLG